MNEYSNAAYRAFDPDTAFRLKILDAGKMTESGRMLVEQGLADLKRANELVVEELDLAAGLFASGDGSWRNAPAMAEQSAMVARAYRRQLQSPGNSFFVRETLCGRRTLTVSSASAGGDLVGDRETNIGVQTGANNFLPLCTVVGPSVGAGNELVAQFDALPTITILASESSQAADATPDTAGSSIGPVNLATYVEASKRWTLQSRGGAESLQRVILAALRTKAMVQIIEGAGSGGEVLGLTANGDISSGSGTTIAWAGICAAMEAVEDGAGDGELAWVVTAPAATILRQREKASGSGVILDDGRIGGYPAIVVGGTSNAHAVFGKWRDLIVCEWSPLELLVNPFANFPASLIGVRGWFSFNAAPAVLSSFYTIPDIT